MLASRKQATRYTDKVIRDIEALPDKPITIFTAKEDDLIRQYYPTKGAAIAEYLGKTANQVKNRACRLGVRRV